MTIERVMLTHLKEAGLVVGSVDEMMDKFLGSKFQPHGLGHLYVLGSVTLLGCLGILFDF